MSTLADVKDITSDYLRIGADEFDDEEYARHFKSVGTELIRKTFVTQQITNITLVANNALVDLSSVTDFEASMVIDCRLVLVDRGTYNGATAYVVNDMIVGDGSPDALFYKNILASTGVEPPNTTNWQRVNWKGGEPVDIIDYDAMCDYLDGRKNQYRSSRMTLVEGASVASGTPRNIAFEDDDNAYMWPVPDTARRLQIRWRAPLVAYATTVTLSTITINFDDKWLWPACEYGMVASMAKKVDIRADARAQWKIFLKEAKGEKNKNVRHIQRRTTDSVR